MINLRVIHFSVFFTLHLIESNIETLGFGVVLLLRVKFSLPLFLKQKKTKKKGFLCPCNVILACATRNSCYTFKGPVNVCL